MQLAFNCLSIQWKVCTVLSEKVEVWRCHLQLKYEQFGENRYHPPVFGKWLGGKIKRRILCGMSKVQICVYKNCFIGKLLYSFISTLSVAPFVLQ